MMVIYGNVMFVLIIVVIMLIKDGNDDVYLCVCDWVYTARTLCCILSADVLYVVFLLSVFVNPEGR